LRRSHGESFHQGVALSLDLLKRLYAEMLRIRLVEERIAELYPEKEIRCPVHLCIGQEAIPVGVSATLHQDDYVLSGHRAHGHYLAKGGDLCRMMAELYGKETGCAHGHGGSMHLTDRSVGFLGATPIVASSIPIATGVAFGTLLRGDPQVTVVYFGEGATEEGVFHESLNFAVLKKLPILFVCENNLYSVYSPLSVRQPKGREMTTLAEAHGCESFQIDGNNVDQIYSSADNAVQKARKGNGPTFLECKTYRWKEHCGPYDDTHLGYRSIQEYDEWHGRCPIQRIKDVLCVQKSFNESDQQHLVQSLLSEIENAVNFAKTSPFPIREQRGPQVFSSHSEPQAEQAA